MLLEQLKAETQHLHLLIFVVLNEIRIWLVLFNANQAIEKEGATSLIW